MIRASSDVRDFLEQKTQPFLVLYYADWCPHCTVFMGKNAANKEDRKNAAWELVKRRTKKELPGVSIVEIENDVMSSLPKKHQVRAFPIVKFYPMGCDKPGVEYNGFDRSPGSIVDFVARHQVQVPNGKKPATSKGGSPARGSK